MHKQIPSVGHLTPDYKETSTTNTPQHQLDNTKGMFQEIEISINQSKNMLLQQINQGLSEQFWSEYHSINSRRRVDSLNLYGLARLYELTTDLEKANNQRLKLVIKFCSIDQTDIETQILGLKSVQTNFQVSHIQKSIKKQVLQTSKGLCEYCQSQEAFSFTSYLVEHITTSSIDQKDIIENLVFSCQGCSNTRNENTKSTDPVTGKIINIYNPRVDVWSDNFCWSEDFTNLVGLTAIGRATIEKLKLNRETLKEYRSVLISINKHPFFLC